MPEREYPGMLQESVDDTDHPDIFTQPRNLARRVELLVPVEAPKPRRRLQKILGAYFKDNVKARELLADGSYRQLAPDDQHSAYRSQEVLHQAVLDEARAVEFSQRTTFEPHLPDNGEA